MSTTPMRIHNAVNYIRDIHEKPREDETLHSEQTSYSAHWREIAFEEVGKVMLFVNGPLSSIQTVFAWFQESKSRNELSFKKRVY